MKGRVYSKEEKESKHKLLRVTLRFDSWCGHYEWVGALQQTSPHEFLQRDLESGQPVLLRPRHNSDSELGGGKRRSDQRARCSRPFFKGKLVPHEIDPLLRVRPTSRSPPSRSCVALALPPRSLGAALACLRDGLSFAGATGSRLFRHAPTAPSNTRNLSSDSPHRSLFASNLSRGPRKPKRPRPTDAFSGIEPFFKAPRQ